MIALVLGVVLAAAGSTDVEGAVTVSGRLARRQAASVGAQVHGRVDLSRDFGRFFVEGHASVLFTGGSTAVGLTDLGSRLTLGYRPTGFVKRVSLELLPFNAATRLPVFDWANSWGQPPFPAMGVFAPVLTAQLDTQAGAVWLSGRFKTAQNPRTQFNELAPDVFLGFEVPLPAGLRLEGRAAWLSYGFNAPLGSVGISLPAFGAGGAARLSWTWNEAVGPAVDLITYATDPLRFERFFVSEPRRAAFAAWVGLEGGGAAQQLADPDRFGRAKAQPMGWVDLQVRLRLRAVRLFGTARVQSVTQPFFDLTGVIPGFALPSSAQSGPILTGYLGADWTLRDLKVTPGLMLKVTQYGWVRYAVLDPGGNNPVPGSDPARVLMLGPNSWYARLAPGKTVAPFIAAKASARWEVLSFASLVAELELEKDLNDYSLPMSGFEVPAPVASDQLTVTAQLFVQARF